MKQADKGICRTVAREVSANFKAWFERNFVNRRAGRIGNASYQRAGCFDDRTGDWTWYSDAYGRAYYDYTEPLTSEEEAFLVSNPLILGQLVLGVTDLRGLRCLRRGLTMQTNRLQQKSYRSKYYSRDNERRRRLAAERRKIRRRTTLNPCPSPEMLRDAFAHIKDSIEAKIRFGGMLHDLACYVDSCLKYDENGNIVGRNAGIKGWLAENVPELHARYKTVMRYKALAMRIRQAAGVEDPVPTSTLLEEEYKSNHNTTAISHMQSGLAVETYRPHSPRKSIFDVQSAHASRNRSRPRCNERDCRHEETLFEYYADKSQEMQGNIDWGRRIVRKLCAECRNTLIDAFRRVDVFLDVFDGKRKSPPKPV